MRIMLVVLILIATYGCVDVPDSDSAPVCELTRSSSSALNLPVALYGDGPTETMVEDLVAIYGDEVFDLHSLEENPSHRPWVTIWEDPAVPDEFWTMITVEREDGVFQSASVGVHPDASDNPDTTTFLVGSLGHHVLGVDWVTPQCVGAALRLAGVE